MRKVFTLLETTATSWARAKHIGLGWTLVLAVALSSGCASNPPQPVTPQRPSFSSDTSTTSPGTVEVELGVSVDDQESVDSPVNLKWGATESTELFVGWSPYVRAAAGETEQGVGDVVIGTRVRVNEASGAKPSGAFQMAAKLPVADEDKQWGTGVVDFFGAAIATSVFGGSTVTGFYQLGVLSDPGATVDLSHGLSVAWAHPVATHLGGFVEITGVFTPSVDDETVFAIVGLGYSVRSNVALDAAGLVGLSPDAPDYLFTIGATVNVGKLLP